MTTTNFPGGIVAPIKNSDGTAITDLTDNSGGTASDTIAAVSATYVQAEVRNAIASLSAKINALAGNS